jgi:uncharacterized damage-inducible protein DinB
MATRSQNEMIERLRDVPARIATAFGTRSASQLYAAPAEGGWSVAEILAHLRASDDILAYRAYMILARDNPPLPAFDERHWAEIAGYGRLDVLDSLQVYTLRREELVAMLRELPPEAWARAGQHEQRGPVTLLDALTALVEHEEEHVAQLEADLK